MRGISFKRFHEVTGTSLLRCEGDCVAECKSTTLELPLMQSEIVQSIQKNVVGEATRDSPDRKYLSQIEEKTHVLTVKFQKTFY